MQALVQIRSLVNLSMLRIYPVAIVREATCLQLERMFALAERLEGTRFALGRSSDYVSLARSSE